MNSGDELDEEFPLGDGTADTSRRNVSFRFTDGIPVVEANQLDS